MISEVNIEQYLIKEVKKLGGRIYKFVSPGNNGVPDRLILFPYGPVYFVECKRPKGGRVSKLQLAVSRQFAAVGHTVHFVSTYKEVDEFINYITSQNIL